MPLRLHLKQPLGHRMLSVMVSVEQSQGAATPELEAQLTHFPTGDMGQVT